jgi:hypothetical protein
MINKSIESLIVDDKFCRWVLSPNKENTSYWLDWMQDSQERIEMVEAAKKIVLSLHDATEVEVPETELAFTWNEINQKTKGQAKVVKMTWVRSIAAAVALFLLAFSYFQWTSQKQSLSNEVATTEHTDWNEITNQNSTIQTIQLEDGSTVELHPGSTLKHPRYFAEKIRIVELKGNAFFDIHRDTTRAFYVYTDDTVVRVLGTSFFVSAAEDDEEVEVIVKTGKVAVYNRNNLRKVEKTIIPDKKTLPTIIVPNQKIVFNKESEKTIKKLVKAPMLVKPLEQIVERKFEEVPARTIFRALAEAYEVEIFFDKNAKVDCTMTTTLTDQSLFEKLEIICRTLGLTYYEKGVSIYIKGKCQ